MSNFFYLILDMTAPANPSVSINNGANYTTNQIVDLTIGTTDVDTSGYQIKIFGDIDNSFDSNIKETKEESAWIAFNNSKQIKLSDGDGLKTINVVIRDDVYNESTQVSDSINLDTSLPTITITNPDVPKISKNQGKNVASLSFIVDKPFTKYKVKVVTAENSLENSGSIIPTANGSVNTSGTGSFPANTPITIQINGTDLETVSQFNGNGKDADCIKIFVLDESGKWSV